jgi:hypothetical protein
MIGRACALSVFWLLVSAVSAYEVQTHEAISKAAVEGSVLKMPNTLEQLGLRPLQIDDPRQTFPKSTPGGQMTIEDLIQFGARWEDDLSVLQALRHFYDPVGDRALDLPDTGTSLSTKSPDWALEDQGDYAIPAIADQKFSYKDARSYLFNALTDPSDGERKRYFGLTFQTLGHVIHHLQDMAQPQHVRNDVHCDHVFCAAVASITGERRFYAPSLYEKYTNLDVPSDPFQQILPKLPFGEEGSAAVYSGNQSTTPFKSPRQFWRTTPPNTDISTGKGIAEYTNRNFFSAGTIFAYSSPPPRYGINTYYSPIEIVDIAVLLPGTGLSGSVRFWDSDVTDTLAGGPASKNKRALSEGLLDSDVVQYYSTNGGPGNVIFSLNRFTFDAAHHYLIPRAVGYSAGLINYFFRGQMEITPPDEGVYAIVDHTIENQRDANGFRKIKLKIKNVTPGGTDAQGQALVESIPDNASGTLVAVAKFHRNNCYQPDLSGEYGSPGIDWRICRSQFEDAVASQPIPVPNGINQDATPVTFNFPAPVPINATDLYLQVVYRGPLGDEPDAVMVATKDISEATYDYVFSGWDQYLYCGYGVISSDPPCAQIYTFKESFCDQSHPDLTFDQCKARFGGTFKFRANPVANPLPGYDPANPVVPPGQTTDIALEPPFSPMGALPTPVGSFTRVAWLADLAPTERFLVVTEQGVGAMAYSFIWQSGQLRPTINQLDLATNGMVTNRQYACARGVCVETTPYDWNPELNDYVLLSSGTASNIPPLILVPSQINF